MSDETTPVKKNKYVTVGKMFKRNEKFPSQVNSISMTVLQAIDLFNLLKIHLDSQNIKGLDRETIIEKMKNRELQRFYMTVDQPFFENDKANDVVGILKVISRINDEVV